MKTKRTAGKGQELSFSRSKIFFYVFVILIFGFAVYYFAEIKGDIKLFVKVHPAWLALAFAAQFGTYLFNSIIWRSLLRVFAKRSDIRIMKLFQASIVTLFINQTIPSVNLSGNIYFFNFLKKRGVGKPSAFSLLFFELLTYYTAVVGIILILLFTCFFLKGIPLYYIIIFLAGIAAFVLFAILIGLLGRGKTVVLLLKKLSHIRFLEKRIHKFKKIPFGDIKNPWRVYREHPVLVFVTILFHCCVFLSDAITLFALFQGLGVHITFLSVLIGFVLTKIISLLPFLPGALVLYEGSMTFFYVHFGVPFAVAAVVTLLYRALSFWLPIPVGLFLYRRLQKPKNR
ncbi:MAG TPA: lysylphosphatidylglycerol synthase transmembrane domain-containing protein [Chitinophagaceae bacterium]|nr:lysylphosphatidylglycerol synthase transmembrane domain-containing protein [Chitinophagaceae bacterium]